MDRPRKRPWKGPRRGLGALVLAAAALAFPAVLGRPGGGQPEQPGKQEAKRKPEKPDRANQTAKPAARRGPDVLLLTLDTTRADFLGCYGAEGAATPNLDSLAARGLRYARALTSSPLTLPAHASLLTGLEPPQHGLHDNGSSVLGDAAPTLAARLRDAGYETAAFVASRVLDRRFGLDRGFGHYDDRMSAEQLGEYGYPERDAAAVTGAALAWLAAAPADRPLFLWVHYYDPHSPYRPPGGAAGADPRTAYAGEIAFMDDQIGRLLAAVEKRPGEALVAAAGDHGESLGEHGERAHGIFLYRAALEVPLLLAGPGVPRGTVEETVGTVRLAPTLLSLAGGDAAGFGVPLPGLPGVEAPPPRPVYSETHLPTSAYGWSSLEALSDGRWRLIVAPRPELYDFVADPGELHNRIDDRRREARRLQGRLEEMKRGFATAAAPAAEVDAELAAALRSLGYAAGARRPRPGGIDPKDGIGMLDELEEAKLLMSAGNWPVAIARLEDLNRRSPDNIPFLGQLAFAQLQAGRQQAAVETYRQAVELNPRLDFLHLNLARALLQLDRNDEARREFELVLELNPRFAEAWLSLAQLANQEGDAKAERRLLERAVAAGTASALVLARLAQLELAAGELEAAGEHLEAATGLLPDWATGWLVRGQLELRRGRTAAAAPFLERAARLGGSSPEAREARRLLRGLRR